MEIKLLRANVGDAKKIQEILLSLSGFVIVWAVVTDAWGYSGYVPVRYGSYIYAYFSRLIWVLPAIWMIFRHSDSLNYDRKQLLSRPVLNRSFVIVLSVSFLISFGIMLANHKGFWLNPEVNCPLEIIKFAAVGFVEEAVFRGWGYNALSKVTTGKKAAIFSTVFFVLLHWPAYFIRLYRFGILDDSALLTQSISAAIWGVVCCWLLKKGKTLWNPVIAHAVYDVLNVLLIG